MKEMEARLREAWKLKLSQRIEECQTVLESFGNSEHIEVKILRASILRSLGQIDGASFALGDIRASLMARGFRFSPQLRFESGFIHFLQGDFSLALEEFLAAAAGQDRLFLPRSFPLVNALLCLENLGMPFDEVLASLREDCQRNEVPAGVLLQIEAFEMRAHFHSGRLEKIFPEKTAPGFSEMNQVEYYRFWLAQLPYHSNSRPLQARDLEQFVLSNPIFHQRPYRLRTFQGLPHADDARVNKPSELIDRAYLWTWRWLANEGSMPLENLLKIFAQLPISQIGHRLTIEDSLFLRNSLLWISLFDPASSERIEQLLKPMRKKTFPEFPLLEFEAKVALYLRERIAGRSCSLMKEELRAAALWNSQTILLRDLVEAVDEPGPKKPVGVFTALAGSLSKLISRNQTTTERVVVDPVLQEIRLGNNSKRISSPHMVAALFLLRENPTVTTQEFSAKCFGIPRYDSTIHQIKILNLLARVRNHFKGTLTFGIKNGFVISSGSWENVHFLQTEHRSESLINSNQWMLLLRSDKQRTPEKEHVLKSMKRLSSVQAKEQVSRREIESVIGKSRATTTRLLERWILEGLLIKEGAARSTRYRLSSELYEKLNQGKAA